MFEKNMRVAYLLDFYIDALDEHIAGVMRSYYEDDLSLAEIASDIGISRQGIRHLIKKGEEQLLFFEERFGLAKRFDELTSASRSILDVYNKLAGREEFLDEATTLKNVIEIISKGNSDVRESN